MRSAAPPPKPLPSSPNLRSPPGSQTQKPVRLVPVCGIGQRQRRQLLPRPTLISARSISRATRQFLPEPPLSASRALLAAAVLQSREATPPVPVARHSPRAVRHDVSRSSPPRTRRRLPAACRSPSWRFPFSPSSSGPYPVTNICTTLGETL